jgi:acyl dehydratase
MAIDYDTLLNWTFDEIVQSYTQRDTMLYALGLGLGSNCSDEDELRFVYEAELQTFPTMAVVLGHPGPWMTHPRAGVNMLKVLHAEQHLQIHKPLPVAATIRAENKVLEVVDKGAEKGALIITERKLYDQNSAICYCTQRSTAFARGDGGFGGPVTKSAQAPALPDRAADFSADIEVSTQAALLYRLSGDYNPLHADPRVAVKAGFERPILHGLATYGVAARALVCALNITDLAALKSFGARFSAPVYPGETIRTVIWREGSEIFFRSHCLQRDVVVLNNGCAELG